MTGTGGFTIEAILSGRSAVGIDLDQEMIQGAKKNLEWAGSQLNPFVQGDATNIKDALRDSGIIPFAGVVLDPPYGRNSHGSMDHQDLLQKTLESARDVVDGGLVLILPSEPRSEQLDRPLAMDERPSLKHYAWETIEMMLNETGWCYQNSMVRIGAWLAWTRHCFRNNRSSRLSNSIASDSRRLWKILAVRAAFIQDCIIVCVEHDWILSTSFRSHFIDRTNAFSVGI